MCLQVQEIWRKPMLRWTPGVFITPGTYHFSKYFLLELKLFRHNSYYNKNLLRNSPKIGKKVGIHLYENILSEPDKVAVYKKMDTKTITPRVTG